MSTKRKLSAKLGQPMVKQSAKPVTKEQINDARAYVTGGANTEEPSINGIKDDVVEISSDSSSDNEDEGSEDDEEHTGQTTPPKLAQLQKTSSADQASDEEMEDADLQPISNSNLDEQEEQAEPSFGDLMHANTSTPIDVAAFSHPDPHSNHNANLVSTAPSTSASLGTVLTQALRTNDTALLESCLSTPDPAIIRATIQRLSSPLASTLLSSLASRLHRRPGRAGSLMVWIQWTLVTHGGYLATQKDLVAQLRELNKVIEERARSLTSLLSLKGKLDMLEAQMALRRAVRSQREVDEDDEDEAVIYIEDSDDEAAPSDSSSPRHDGARPKPNGVRRASTSSSVSEDMPNGLSTEIDDVASASDEEGSSSGSDAGGDFVDDEAEESDADEDSVEHESTADVDEDEESDDAAPAEGRPPAKMQRVAGMFSRVR